MLSRFLGFIGLAALIFGTCSGCSSRPQASMYQIRISATGQSVQPPMLLHGTISEDGVQRSLEASSLPTTIEIKGVQFRLDASISAPGTDVELVLDGPGIRQLHKTKACLSTLEAVVNQQTVGTSSGLYVELSAPSDEKVTIPTPTR